MDAPLLSTECPNLKLMNRGKVRDLYEIDHHTMLFVATDRVSAFDVIMKNGIPGKGQILTSISEFWFTELKHLIPNHLITTDFDQMPAIVHQYRDQLQGRCMLVKKLQVVPIEAIVRGYITGSAWKEYSKDGSICGTPVAPGLIECQQLPKPMFTPSTKANIGDRDENINQSQMNDLIGQELGESIAKISISIYEYAAALCKSKGILVADTKFEFGLDRDGVLHLVDEALTPDSSRFWLASEYMPGIKVQVSLDKQYLRNYLLELPEFSQSPSSVGVELPAFVVTETLKKYSAVYELITGTVAS